jgi:hypothetical protein
MPPDPTPQTDWLASEKIDMMGCDGQIGCSLVTMSRRGESTNADPRAFSARVSCAAKLPSDLNGQRFAEIEVVGDSDRPPDRLTTASQRRSGDAGPKLAAVKEREGNQRQAAALIYTSLAHRRISSLRDADDAIQALERRTR